MSKHLRFDEDIDNYEPSDSEDEYTEKENNLLKKIRTKKTENSDSETEVLGVASSGSDDDENEDVDDKSDLALSDVEGQGEDGDLPDIRAWGKDKRKYYSTDYVDADYGGFQGKDAFLAELEEEEARKLQKQLVQELDDDDYRLDILAESVKDDKKVVEEVIKTDLSKLSKREKLEILKKESPELFALLDDFKVKMTMVKDYLSPIIQKGRKGEIPKCRALDFVQTQYELILNYCTNIYMYLLLKSSRVNVKHHPVIKRLYQYRHLLSQLEPVYEEVIKPQLEIMLSETKEPEEPKEKKKKLKFLAELTKQSDKKKKHVDNTEKSDKMKKIARLDATVMEDTEIPKNAVTDSSESDSEIDREESRIEEEQNGEKESEVTKRAITYQMAKNKGLTPHRKKEQRNPRVKHRNKYRKALIRRKGAVREPRHELSKYSGEVSGIKAFVSKSIKIKT